MYDMHDLHTTPVPMADLVFWAAIVAGPTPLFTWGLDGTLVRRWEGDGPTVALNKDGSYMATLVYRGADVTMMEEQERLTYLYRLQEVLKQLGTGWALLADEWHEPSCAYPTSAWGQHAVPCFLDASRRALVTSGVLHESRTYLTVSWKPPSTRKQQWYEQVFMTERKVVKSDDENRASFLHTLTRWGDSLSGVLPAVRWLTPDETVTYLKNTVNWDRTPIQLPAMPMFLDAQLTASDFLPGHTPQLGRLIPESDPPQLEQLLRPITVKTWPGDEGLGYRVPAALQTLPFPYRYTVRAILLDKLDGESVWRDLMEKWVQMIWSGWAIVAPLFPSDAPDQAASLDAALVDLKDDRTRAVYLTPVVTVWGETREVLDTRERTVLKVLQEAGLLCMPEVVNACQAWQGTLPGDLYHGVRLPPLPIGALAFLLPHGMIYAGPERDAHLDDVPLFVASSEGTPFRYVLHRGEVGNTLIVGPTRKGKSALLAFIAMQFLRYANAQVFLFDKDYALYTATILAGGSHYDLGKSTTRGFHILGRIDESDDERRWAQTWIEALCEAQGLRATAAESDEIWQALGRVARQPAHLRTLSTFCECFQVRRLKPAFKQFLRGNTYGYFDAAEDSFTLDWWTTFELSTILDQPAALPHAMHYIFHRMEERFDGRPTLVEIDEAWKVFEHPLLQARVKDWLKAKAKKNVSTVLSWQEIVDASTSPLWQAMRASCETEIYLPNPVALDTDVLPHYRSVGLQPGQIHTLALARPHSDYLYKTADATRLFQLRLSPLERVLCAASTQEEIAALRALQGQDLDESLGAAWLRQRGYPQEADVFEQHYVRRAA